MEASEVPTPTDPEPPPRRPSNERSAAPRDPRAVWVAAFIVAFGALFFWNAWERDFWDPNEPRFALVARSMENAETTAVPRLGGAPHFHVPPLIYWLARGSEALTRLDARASYRLPIALFATLGLFLTYLLGKRFADGRVGFLAAAIQASSIGYFRRAAWLDDDLVFAVCCQLALVSFLLALERDTLRRWKWIGWVGLAGAALTKSLFLGFGLVFGSLLCCVFIDPRNRSLRQSMAQLLSAPCILLFCALVGPWYGWVLYEYGAVFVQEHIVGQHFGRLLDAYSHRRLPHYYLVQIFIGFLPWSLLLPLGILHCKDRIGRPGERVALLSLLFPLVVLSFVSSKKPGYILVVWPWLALSVALGLFETKEKFSLWEDYLRNFGARLLPWLLRLPIVLVLVLVGLHVAGVLPTVLVAVLGFPDSDTARLEALFPQDASVLYGFGLLGVAAILVAVLSRRVAVQVAQGQFPRAAFEFACGVAFLFFSWSFFYEGINEAKSPRRLVETLVTDVGEAPLKVYGRMRPSLQYYFPRELETLPYPDPLAVEDPALSAIMRYLDREQKVYLLAASGDLDKLTQLYASLGPRLVEQSRGYLGWTREYVLLSNRR